MKSPSELALAFRPLTPDRWTDLEALFGPRGACGGCWCMWWRLVRSDFEKGKGAANREALRALVEAGPPPGLLAYDHRQPVGWCALAPREAYSRLARARTLKPLDARPVWSVTCFFVARPYRRRGVTAELLKAAARWAASRGATILEGYPVDTRGRSTADAFAYTGLPSAFEAAGFREAARPSPTRPIMRLSLTGRDSGEAG